MLLIYTKCEVEVDDQCFSGRKPSKTNDIAI